jgi:hypothetical protein
MEDDMRSLLTFLFFVAYISPVAVIKLAEAYASATAPEPKKSETVFVPRLA